MAKLLNFIGTAIIIIVIILCLSLALPRLFGVSSYTVMSGSMEPTIPVGSIVYAKATEPQTLAGGDIIVFHDGKQEIPVTHRIIENDTENAQVTTKGDANSTADFAPIPYPNIIGKVVLHIPFLGRLLIPLGTLFGKIAMLAMIVGGLLLCEVAKSLRKNA